MTNYLKNNYFTNESDPQDQLGDFIRLDRLSAKAVKKIYENGFMVIYVDTVVYIENTKKGFLWMNAGNWYTATTKKHINDHLPTNLYIKQKNYEWYLCRYDSAACTICEFEKIKKTYIDTHLLKTRGEIYIYNN